MTSELVYIIPIVIHIIIKPLTETCKTETGFEIYNSSKETIKLTSLLETLFFSNSYLKIIRKLNVSIFSNLKKIST